MGSTLYDSKICRLCAEDNPNGVYIYDKVTQEIDLEGIINKYLPFKVSDEGTLPRTICPGCNIQLHSTVQFFDLLAEGQKKIKLLLRKQFARLRREELAQVKRGELLKLDESLQPSLGTIESVDEEPQQITINSSQNGEVLLTDVEDQLSFDVVPGKDLYSPDHPLSLEVLGETKQPRKRGRPRKPYFEYEKIPSPVETPAEAEASKGEETDPGKDEDGEGRKKRRRKIPERYKGSVQGKELEKIFREEGVTDEEEEGDKTGLDVVLFNNTEDHNDAEEAEIIGHLETKEGQDLGELVVVKQLQPKVVNKHRTRRVKRKKIRFHCEVCGRGFLHHGRYLFHKSFHKGVKYECTTCHKRFSSKENFELHQKVVGHSGEAGIVEDADGEIEKAAREEEVNRKFICQICEKTFVTKISYEMHMKSLHANEKTYECEYCNKCFAYLNSYKAHMAIHEQTGRKDRFYPCSICGKNLNHPSSVIYHKEAEHNNGRRFVCNKCGKSFKHKQLLQRHQLVHTDSRPFKCNLCTASFKTKANLVNHHATHTGEKKHTCEICEQQFAHKTSLTLHYRWHSGQKPYQCNVCKKRFSQKGNLQEHMRIHTGEKPFSCEFCTRKFTTSSQFKLHMKRHTGERPWKCEFCVKTFLHKDAWKCHIRRHKGEKPFRCIHCTRDFPEQWALKKHMRLHTGEKPYACKDCGKTFADCSNLTKHKKIHERELKREAESNNTDIEYISVDCADPNVAAASTEGVDLSVWNIIRSHLQEDLGAERPSGVAEEDQDNVRQIIYVTYEDNSSSAIKEETMQQQDIIAPEVMEPTIEDSEMAAVEAAENLTFSKEELVEPIQVTDDEGNPIHFTMQDGSALEISSDGQSLQVTTKDGKTIPVHLTTSDGQPITTQMAEDDSLQLRIDSVNEGGASQESQVSASEFHLEDSVQTLEFMTQDGHKVQMVAPFNVVPIDGDYLQIT